MIVRIKEDEMYPYYIICDGFSSQEYEVPDHIVNAYQKTQKKFEKAREDLRKFIATV